ncbi:MAG TPA: S8 family peptidase [Oligoflexia bacterium]|nr:S8 family peptidase [Oligoflexia bacterium]
MHVSHWRALRFAAMAFALSFSAALAADTTEPVTKTPYAPGEVIVKFKSDIRRNKVFMQQLYQEVGVAKVRKFKLGFGSIEHYQLAEGASVEKAIQKLTKTVAVEYAQPNYILKLFRNEDVLDGYDDCHPPVEFLGCVPFGEFIEGRPGIAPKPSPVEPPVADPQQNKVWGLNAISAPEAWKVTTGSQGIVVAVIDTGIDYNHEDLSFNMWRRPGVESEEDDIVGWDFVHDDNLPFDDHMHGTHVAGTIGAVGGNALGIVGVSPKVSLMAVKFLTARGSGTTLDAIRSIDYAVERGARILNNSWGGGADPNNNALRESIGRAEARGVLFVVAAGNDGTDNDRRPTYPASFRAANLIAVAATDSNDKIASFGGGYGSNYGKTSVHLGAPGKDVYSSVPGNRYRGASGTSMATPMVAGAAALLWSMNPNMTFLDVKNRLMATVDPLPTLQGKTITGGRINLARAVVTELDSGGEYDDEYDGEDGDW